VTGSLSPRAPSTAAAPESTAPPGAGGNNDHGELGDGTQVNSDVPVQVGTGEAWLSVSAGNYHTCATQTDESLWCWGYNQYGQLGDGSSMSKRAPVQVGTQDDWTTISAGGIETCGIRNAQTLWCWGLNTYGSLGDGTTINRLVPTRVKSA